MQCAIPVPAGTYAVELALCQCRLCRRVALYRRGLIALHRPADVPGVLIPPLIGHALAVQLLRGRLLAGHFGIHRLKARRYQFPLKLDAFLLILPLGIAQGLQRGDHPSQLLGQILRAQNADLLRRIPHKEHTVQVHQRSAVISGAKSALPQRIGRRRVVHIHVEEQEICILILGKLRLAIRITGDAQAAATQVFQAASQIQLGIRIRVGVYILADGQIVPLAILTGGIGTKITDKFLRRIAKGIMGSADGLLHGPLHPLQINRQVRKNSIVSIHQNTLLKRY